MDVGPLLFKCRFSSLIPMIRATSWRGTRPARSATGYRIAPPNEHALSAGTRSPGGVGSGVFDNICNRTCRSRSMAARVRVPVRMLTRDLAVVGDETVYGLRQRHYFDHAVNLNSGTVASVCEHEQRGSRPAPQVRSGGGLPSGYDDRVAIDLAVTGEAEGYRLGESSPARRGDAARRIATPRWVPWRQTLMLQATAPSAFEEVQVLRSGGLNAAQRNLSDQGRSSLHRGAEVGQAIPFGI